MTRFDIKRASFLNLFLTEPQFTILGGFSSRVLSANPATANPAVEGAGQAQTGAQKEPLPKGWSALCWRVNRLNANPPAALLCL
jgi:hypothetical protein